VAAAAQNRLKSRRLAVTMQDSNSERQPMSDQTSRNPVLTGLFLVLCAIALGFGTHSVWLFSSRVLGSEAPQVEGWMTPRHVIRVFNLPADRLAAILGLTGQDAPFTTLNDLAAERGLAPEVLLQQVQDAITQAGGGA
jgi:hypothetical protein